MYRPLSCLFLLAALSLSITGCRSKEVQFADSLYGIEMQSMMNTCIEMQTNGLLPGVEAGMDASLEFMSDEIEFSNRNDISYPLQLKCIVVKYGQGHFFQFIKQSSNSKWKLSQ